MSRKNLKTQIFNIIFRGLTKSAKKKRGKSASGMGIFKTLIGVVLLAFLGIALVLLPSNEHSLEPIEDGGIVTVDRCVDGDTLVLADGTRIRLIGANTPETVKNNWPTEPFGPEASAYTKKAIAEVKNKVRLEFDGTRTDRYGRTLALVYVGDKMLNEELIREGLATAELNYKYSKKMKDRFSRAEYEAQKARRGIWSQDKP